jgi:hypothetical protein
MEPKPRSIGSGRRLAVALFALCLGPLALGAMGCKEKKKDPPAQGTTIVAPQPAVPPAPGPAAAAPAATGGLAQAAGGLLEFETAIKWEAVTKDWVARRAGWQAAVNAAPTPQALGAQLIALETSMGWGAVQPTWRARRAAWVAEAGAAQTPADVARLLMELETSTKWEVVQSTWAAARPGWMQKLAAVR